MADREKLIELIAEAEENAINICVYNSDCEDCPGRKYGNKCREYLKADHLIANGVTVRERGRWVHPKGYVVSNGFLCTECGHEEASHYPINPRPGGVCTADENGNFFHPPKINFCPNCGADMRGEEDA